GSAAVVSPIALEAVKRIDAIFAIEREINGRSPEDRVQARQEASKPLVDELAIWLQAQRGALSRSAAVAKPIDYMLKRWDRFAAFLN
ncbi:IS66 family transposase, partial [Acinetobacter baumannii]|uniref:IS66 family transposase n=1 Tax=Acinetobacter baumannii TaxID=470 RepID=UPI0013CFC5DA